MAAWHFFVHWSGTDYGAPSYGYFEPYDLWSGIAGLSLAGLIYHKVRTSLCHERGCFRLSRHVVDGSPWCNRHHQAAREVTEG